MEDGTAKAMNPIAGNTLIRNKRVQYGHGRSRQQGAINRSAIAALSLGLLLPLCLFLTVYHQQRKPRPAPPPPPQGTAEAPVCQNHRASYIDIPRVYTMAEKKQNPWYNAATGLFEIPIRRGSMKLVSRDWPTVSKSCDYGEGFMPHDVRFAFSWVDGKLFTVAKDCPDCTQKQVDTITDNKHITRVELYNLSNPVKILSTHDELRLKNHPYINPQYYHPAYLMQNIPLLYYPNFNYDNKAPEQRIYLGIENSKSPLTGYPILINCQLNSPDKRLDGDKLLPQIRFADMPIESITQATVSKYESCTHNYFLFITNSQTFGVRIDLDAQLAPDIDQIFKAVEQEIAAYLIPVGQPTGLDVFNFNHGEP